MNASCGGPTFDWNPDQYLRFEAERRRPAEDLIARIPADDPARICDLGCGAGNITALLRARWPAAAIDAINSSAEMVTKARASYAGLECDWRQGDATRLPADGRYDLLFSNAMLHWLGAHETLFPRLLGAVAPGGWFAVQMPRNFAEPSHTILADLACDARWRDRFDQSPAVPKVGAPERYIALLTEATDSLDVWETVYYHRLSGENPVFAWTGATALKPYLARLDPAEKAEFETEYARRLGTAYPPGPDGRTLLPFRRMFIVARRP